MSIELQFKKGSLALRVLLKDEALSELQTIVSKYQSDEEIQPLSAPVINVPAAQFSAVVQTPAFDPTAVSKEWLAAHSPLEAVNLIGWETNPEKILILGAYHESKGAGESWRSADMEVRFQEARHVFPANFPRDISNAITNNIVAAVTPRTYKISKTGWNKIAEAVSKLGHA